MKKKLFISFKNTFFINTLIIIITNFIVKLLGLINKIAITRMLGTSGMSLYVLSFPTIMLFISISGLSLTITISKLVSESIVSRKYSPKKIVKNACKLSLIISFFLAVIYLILLKPLTIYLLKNENLYYPLLTGAPLIMLVGVSDGLKGYFLGIKKSNLSSMGNLVEQIGRISFSLIFLYLTIPYGEEISVICCLLALSFGEICAIIYCLLKIKKHPIPTFENTHGENKAILDMAIPNTMSRLIGNFTYFLEPIIYTMILSSQGFTIKEIQTTYTIFDAYTIPLLTFISFVPFAITSAMIPGISEANSLRKKDSINYYISKSLIFCLIPVLILSINLFFFGEEYMKLIYGTVEGTSFIKFLTFIFICYYLHVIVVGILQACGYSKKVFTTSTIINFLRLLLIIILSYIKSINLNSVLFATTITMVFGFIWNTVFLFKVTKFKINIKKLFTLTLIIILSMSITVILKHFEIHYLLILVINSLIILSLSYWQNLIEIKSLKKQTI